MEFDFTSAFANFAPTLSNMIDYLLTHGSGQLGRHSVADEPTERSELHRGTWRDEVVVPWKALQNRRFTQRDRSILLRMSEPTRTEVVRQRRDSW
ncbi:hypothetical protein CLV30_101427 [Haloactinopolyspora alba]|uniref:Uncharacterized protein n=1 Tax=Haloactinopolyspora alba TaxID=648780 RepID=A0A2P8EG62_9ACTN|nr:hypothetical protein CLV30_101427 [Haloactinopolyspora alba]